MHRVLRRAAPRTPLQDTFRRRAGPGHPEMVRVPVHPQLDLLDTSLHFGIWERSCFHRVFEHVFHVQELSPVATSDSIHPFVLSQPAT